MSSLRNKILYTYSFSKLVLLIFALVVFADLYYMHNQINAGEAVTDFREASQEMRREEKNLFLYHDFSSIDQLLLQSDAAEATLARGREAFVGIAGVAEVSHISSVLRSYREHMELYPFLDSAQQASARETIRDLGRVLSEASQNMSRRERQALAQATRTASLSLLLAFAGVVVLGLAGGFFLVRQVGRPLREL